MKLQEEILRIQDIMGINENTLYNITTDKDNNLVIGNYKYRVGTESYNDLDVIKVVKSDSNYIFTVKKLFVTKEVPIDQERVNQIISQVPKDEIISNPKSKDGKTIILKKIT